MTRYTDEQYKTHQYAVEAQQRRWDGFYGVRAFCDRCLDPVVWDRGNGGQWLGTKKGRDWSVCHGNADPGADIHIVTRGDIRRIKVLNPDGTFDGRTERWADQPHIREHLAAQNEPIRRKLRSSRHDKEDDVDTEWTTINYTDNRGNIREERVRVERSSGATAPECCGWVFPSDTRLDFICERCLWHAGDHPAPLDLLTFDESLDAGSKSGPKALARRPTLRDALHRFLTS